ncbi:hypothetical protein PNP85_00225 [Halobacterium salinarum]|uniref:Uncharacterized protein n=1 Tax=Halobacterium salinarum TaxID=2242 RepID=A0A841HD92_HALSI|nr:hypothetical protein [Halobacterium salinarum]MBB6090534.1 hypothetical protein [Halobacterium salinarum]MDL0131596.1 hypothetical protein [Halobacterium salinarum]MDL0135362.1 hypothetical protein [Halobacterium salinarum]MDL0137941.1 hypothetical protein [Halobacterium salinarum]MDL0141514.1 hypothetical protein [Halobacterium salinarum]
MTALREYLQDAAHDDALTQEIAAGYYDDGISDARSWDAKSYVQRARSLCEGP